MNKTIIISLTLLSAITGVVGYDYYNVSDQELQDYILTEAINGRVPVIDVSRISPARVFSAYIAVIEKNLKSKITDEDLALKDFNLYNKIRREASKQGYTIEENVKVVNKVKTKEEYK